MDEEDDKLSRPPFLEVYCSSSGKTRRFAAGTESGYALYVMNKKLDMLAPRAFLIEAFKEGEEPVSFGPNAILVSYGNDWKLQTVTDKGFEEAKPMLHDPGRFSSTMKSSGAPLQSVSTSKSRPTISFMYIAKILLASVFLFLLGGMLTYFLENLPALIELGRIQLLISDRAISVMFSFHPLSRSVAHSSPKCSFHP